MMTSTTRKGVRPFSEEDIPLVMELHRSVFHISDAPPDDEYRRYFSDVYLRDPALEGSRESLVYEEDDGSISGFMGVAPLRMSLDGRPVQARITSSFVVHPQKRGWAGFSLMRRFLNGPQDLSIADEANSTTRAIWQELGGSTSIVFSMHWIYPLRPIRLGLHMLLRKHARLASVAAAASAPLTTPLDRIAARLQPAPPQRAYSGRLAAEELTPAAVETAWSEGVGLPALRPDHDWRSFAWQLDHAARLRRHGRLQKLLFRTEEHDIAGWAIYYLAPGGLSEVVQLNAFPPHQHAVLDTLIDHARHGGAAGLRGRLEPCIQEALSDRRCLFFCGPSWTVVHARDRKILDAFTRGDVFFSRLDGEWCLHLH